MNVSRLEAYEHEQALELLKRSQMAQEVELKRKVMERNSQNPIQDEQELEFLRRSHVHQRVELKRNLMGMNLQVPIQGFEMGAWQPNADDQSAVQMPLQGIQIPIQGFEMGAWQPNAYDQSTVPKTK